jgi:hypothetical protein
VGPFKSAAWVNSVPAPTALLCSASVCHGAAAQPRPDHLIDHCRKPQPGGKCADLSLTPIELIDRFAALVPSPRLHRLRYFGVLAPYSPRSVVTALAHGNSGAIGKAPVVGVVAAIGASARNAWATLIARNGEVFPFALCSFVEKLYSSIRVFCRNPSNHMI